MRFVRLLLVAFAALAAGGCAKLTLAWADLEAKGPPARPPIFDGDAPSLDQWERVEKPALQKAFEEDVYGYLPDASSTEIVSRRVIDEAAFGGLAILEEYEIKASATFGAATKTTKPFYVDVLLPAAAGGPVPLIMMESFCPRTSAIPHPGVTALDDGDFCSGGGLMSGLMTYVFGRYIATPPIEAILARGYAIAAIYPSEAVPDSRREGAAALADLAKGHEDARTRWGAVAAWAWIYSRVVDALLTDDRIDDDSLVAWGHSRYAKAALVAAAYDQRIDAVIAHQSGTGGASLNKEKAGETLRSITSQYPHWFAKAYEEYAGREEAMPVDQHELLALIAPRPVLLGNARRDVWSDPSGAFRAARGADPVYELYGARGLDQDRMTPFRPGAEIAFWIRPGTHGVVKEDWPAFLEFLDAHLKGKVQTADN
jgi:hypothetical protein